MKIPIDQVRALEDNQFDYFRSATFARGYLKGYCRLLGLNVNEILSAFDALTMTKAESNIKPVDKVINKQAGFGDPFVILISIVIIAVLVFLAFWWPSFSSSNSAVIDKNAQTDQAEVEEQSDESAALPSVIAPAKAENSDEQATLSQNADELAVDNAVAEEDLPVKPGVVSTGLSAETIAILEKAGVNPEKVEEATKEVENSFLNSLSLIDEINANAFSFDESMAENAGMFWDNFEERGFTAYQNLEEGNQSFWDNWLAAAQNNLTSFDELSAFTIESFSNQMGNALESVVFDSESLGDAFKGVMQGMARSVVNALGQMAAQWLAYKLVQLAIGKSTAVAGAAGLALNAQAQSLMAGLNAFASTAAIPVVGPPAAPAAGPAYPVHWPDRGPSPDAL